VSFSITVFYQEARSPDTAVSFRAELKFKLMTLPAIRGLTDGPEFAYSVTRRAGASRPPIETETTGRAKLLVVAAFGQE
jgi:hypothetical protein